MPELSFFLDDLAEDNNPQINNPIPIDRIITGFYHSENAFRVFIHEKCFTSLQEKKGSIYPPSVANWLHKYSKIFQHATPEEIIFLDTETTGLDRGANTYAFLTGLLYYKDNKWHLKQFFIESPQHEPLLMKLLSEILSDFKILVSYNGKCYDIPLLDNRFKFNKSEYSIRDLEFLDLLHLSRRLWKPILHGCKLQNIETVIFNYIRDYSNDIAGELIPKAYFDYLATNNATEISSVFYHNEEDLFSLTNILNVCTKLDFLDFNYLSSFKIDIFQIAKLLVDIGMLSEALAVLEQMSKTNRCSEESLLLLSQLLKRKKEYSKALEYLEEYSEVSPSICLEMSMLYEHKVKNLSQAFYYSRKAYLLLHEENNFQLELISEAEKRITRIKNKLKKNK